MRRKALGVIGIVGLASLGGCGRGGGNAATPMAYNRNLSQGDALGMFIGHAVQQRTMAQRQQANPTQPVVANVVEPKGE